MYKILMVNSTNENNFFFIISTRNMMAQFRKEGFVNRIMRLGILNMQTGSENSKKFQ